MKNTTLLGLVAVLAAGCGSATNGGTGTMSLHLVDGPTDLYPEVNVSIDRVEIRAGGDWLPLARPARTVNLMALQGGVEELLADHASLPAGTYGELRLVLSTDVGSVKLPDGTTQPLKIPSGAQSGVKLPVHFEVAAGTTKDVFIDFEAWRSVFVHRAGNSAKYLLRPVVRAYDRIVTGSIRGSVLDATTHAAIPGATVTAQVVDASGTPSVVRTTASAADGSFTLDLLPIGGTYVVVAQPVTATAAYDARASAPITLTAAAPIATTALETNTVTPIAIGGAIAPVGGEADADVAAVRQTLDAGGTPALLVVRAGPATVADGAESYALSALPPRASSVVVTRTTVGLDGADSVRSSAPVAVPASGSTTANVSVPSP